jgi:hypothetical protein
MIAEVFGNFMLSLRLLFKKEFDMNSLLIVKGDAAKSCSDRTDGYSVIKRRIQTEHYATFFKIFARC